MMVPSLNTPLHKASDLPKLVPCLFWGARVRLHGHGDFAGLAADIEVITINNSRHSRCWSLQCAKNTLPGYLAHDVREVEVHGGGAVSGPIIAPISHLVEAHF